MSSSGRRPAGLAAALEEERLELAGLSDQRGSSHRNRTSPYAIPRRSILDSAPTPGYTGQRHGSIAGIGVGVTPPSARRAPTPSPSPSPAPPRNNSTPTETETATTTTTTTTATAPPPPRTPYTNLKTAPPPRPPEPRASAGKEKSSHSTNSSPVEARRPSIRWDSRLDMPPSANGLRRSSHQQEKEKAPKLTPSKNAMAAVMSGFDLSFGLTSFSRGRDSGRSSATRGTSLDSHVSIYQRGRSNSPKRRYLNPNTRNHASGSPKPAPAPAAATTDTSKEDKVEEEDGSPVNPSTIRRGSSETDGRASASGDERLEKDMYDSENNLLESSEEDSDEPSSSEEDTSSGTGTDEVKRGRKKAVDRDPPGAAHEPETSKSGLDEETPTGRESNTTEGSDLIHSSKLGPVPRMPDKVDIHPRTSFDSPSAANTPFGSEDEAELSDIKRAQKLSIQMSTIDNSVPNRSIRTIIRGDYSNTQEDGEGGHRRQRKYLVTTDLGEESVYALEWTIGTILRDGDTMFAVCALPEETGTQIGEGAKAVQDTAAVVGSQTEETLRKSQHDSNTNLPRALLGRLGSGTDSKPGSVDARGMTKAESERAHAVQLISQTCVRLLRKTVLQVRVAVEVIHCKSPKHLITEAIDGLEPTLVIVGARGRSALKGVLLGSFSNYLVTHSSVPVMVARKKLKKQTKNKKTNVRLSNNLTTPKKLAQAKVD